jgi:hypothetical protein
LAGDLGLADEAAAQLRVVAEFAADALERHVPVQFVVAGQEHLPESAAGVEADGAVARGIGRGSGGGSARRSLHDGGDTRVVPLLRSGVEEAGQVGRQTRKTAGVFLGRHRRVAALPEPVLGPDQGDDSLGVARQLRETLQVGLDPRRVAGLQAELQIDVGQFLEDHEAERRVRRQVIIQVGRMALLPVLLEALDDFLQPGVSIRRAAGAARGWVCHDRFSPASSEKSRSPSQARQLERPARSRSPGRGLARPP